MASTRKPESFAPAFSKGNTVTVSPKGQVVIPKKLRQEFGIGTGDVLYAYKIKGGIGFKRIPAIQDVQQALAPQGRTSTDAVTIPTSLEAIIDRKVDGLLEEYQAFQRYGTPPKIVLSPDYRELVLALFDDVVAGGREWYETHADSSGEKGGAHA